MQGSNGFFSDTPFPGKGPDDDRQGRAQDTEALRTEKLHFQSAFRSMHRQQKAYTPNTETRRSGELWGRSYGVADLGTRVCTGTEPKINPRWIQQASHSAEILTSERKLN